MSATHGRIVLSFLSTASTRSAPASPSSSAMMAELSRTKRRRVDSGIPLTVLAALRQQALKELLTLGRAAQGADRVSRQRHHPDRGAFVDPSEPVAALDAVASKDLGRYRGLTPFGNRCIHS